MKTQTFICPHCGETLSVNHDDDSDCEQGFSAGYLVKQWRQSMGVTQAALAKRAKVNRATIASVESGRNVFSLRIAKRISFVTGVPIFALRQR